MNYYYSEFAVYGFGPDHNNCMCMCVYGMHELTRHLVIISPLVSQCPSPPALLVATTIISDIVPFPVHVQSKKNVRVSYIITDE